jgi:hypothetical protein
MLPPDNPSTIRAAKSIVRLVASASMTKLTTVPRRLKISTGRSPTDRTDRPEWRCDELAQRKRREQQADDERRGPERLRVERQQRDDDPETYQVHEDRQKNNGKRAHGELVIVADPSTCSGSAPS